MMGSGFVVLSPCWDVEWEGGRMIITHFIEWAMLVLNRAKVG